MQLLFFTLAFFLFTNLSLAVDPNEVLKNPVLEKKAREISKGLRCLVCQNQSIDDSDAGLARDLRLLVRKRLLAGDDSNEVINYIVSRYGEFVLLKPPINATTLVLWFGPLIFILIGIGAAILFFKKNNIAERKISSKSKTLSREEQHRLKNILKENK